MRWSWCARHLFPCCNALYRTSESPSKTMRWKPHSKASSKALLAAITSTSITENGKRISCDRDAITRPASFRVTTPSPALLSPAKVAPSKFTLTSDDPVQSTLCLAAVCESGWVGCWSGTLTVAPKSAPTPYQGGSLVFPA